MCSHFNIEDGRKHLKNIILCYSKKRKNTTEMQKQIRAVHGASAVTDRMCQKWFPKFCEDFSLDDAPRLGRPVDWTAIKSRH